MKTAEINIYNYHGKEEKLLFEEMNKGIEEIKKIGLEIDEIIVKFSEKPKYQSDPEEGNLPKKIK